jgi:PAS domain S-box-containing protein
VYVNKVQKGANPVNEQTIFGENSASSILIIKATSEEIGTILHANYELEKTLGFKRTEVIGKNISLIMPRLIGRKHDLFIKRYFDTAKAKVIDIKRQLLARANDGYL